ncbi:MAG TPA: DivIVA domain-containing protein [Actinomycetota bacterium]|nr:DivIVA domain-containing protein [Actinomycetota bacterium]
MNATELDLPLLPSADQVRRREFATVRRGYDPDQVRDYLYAVANALETLEQRLRETKLELETALRLQQEPRRDPYQELAARLTDVLRSADQQAERITQEAREESRRIVEEARSEADRIRLDAQARAERAHQESRDVLERAREEADRMLSGLAERRRSVVDQLQRMQERLLDVARELEETIEPARADAEAELPAEEEAAEAIWTGPPPADEDDPWAQEAVERDTLDLTDLEVPALDLDLGEEEAERPGES